MHYAGAVSTTATGAARPLRADAARNRDRILAGARAVFAERGLDASLEDVADRAGVGIGTLYRRFTDREALIDALFDERIRGQVARLEVALAHEDAWSGLLTLLEVTCAELASDRGLRQLFLSTAHGLEHVARARAQLYPLTAQLVERAKSQGELHPQFDATDVPLLMVLISSVGDFAADVAPDLWRRYLQLFVTGMRVRPEPTSPLADALTPEQMQRAMST
jgi:AcrR family transcriptional regulator